MSHPKEADTSALLAELHRAGVELIVVGGTAALLHGSTLGTLDLDIVHRRDPQNVDRLLAVLQRLDAVHRYDPARRQLRPTAEQLLGSGQINLSTTLGPLDPLCELEPGRGYEELLPNTEVMRDEDVEIRVLDLPTLIEIKSKVGRSKDKLVVAELIAILDERHRADQFLMIVRDTFRTGRGTVVTGRVESGTVHVGDRIEMVIDGLPTETTVLEIELQRRSVPQASVGDDVAVALEDVAGVFIRGGDLIRGG